MLIPSPLPLYRVYTFLETPDMQRYKAGDGLEVRQVDVIAQMSTMALRCR